MLHGEPGCRRTTEDVGATEGTTLDGLTYRLIWRTTLNMNTVRDTLDKTRGDFYYAEDVAGMIREKLRLAGNNAVRATAGKVVTINSLLAQWHKIIDRSLVTLD